jgi:Flp pilus assembly protein TadB
MEPHMTSASIGLVAASIVVLLAIRGRPLALERRAVGLAAPRAHGAWRWPRRTVPGAATEVDVAAWCDDVARSVRSGRSLTVAVQESATGHSRLASAIEPIDRALRRGQSLGAALGAIAIDPSSPVGLAVAVLRSCADLGGPAASPLERVAATLRDRDAIRQEQRAHSAQAQLSARVLTLVPVGMLALLAGTDPQVRAVVGSTAGIAAVTAGATLNVAGWCWMQRIIGQPASPTGMWSRRAAAGRR